MIKNVLLTLLLLVTISCSIKMPQTAPLFELEKSQCRGTCPVYTFQVYENGYVRFDGKLNVEKIGLYEGKISSQEIERLKKLFMEASFFSFEDEYKKMVMDLPTTWISFRNGSQSKKIKDYYGAPLELKALEKELDQLRSSIKLKKINETLPSQTN